MKILMSHLAACVVALAAASASAEPGAGRALAIVAPSEQRMIFDQEGPIVITLAASPPLHEGELIVLRVDEQQIIVLPAGLTRFALSGVQPGTHELEAVIVDADANPVAAAHPVAFDVSQWMRI